MSEATTRGVDIPAQWGHLQLHEVLGQGAYGTVYRAYDPGLQQDVALKLLRADPGTDADGLLTEARRLARVRHPNVVTVHGAELHDGQVGFWMELVQGATLEDILARQGTMSAPEAAVLGSAMAQALAAVHAAGLVHGDVKCRNVVREKGGRYVLTDFGAARDLAGGAPAVLVGTPAYMAPELFEHRRPGTRTDLYSLGVLLFHAVTLEYPVAGGDFASVREAHRRGERRHLRDVRADLPAAFVHMVERCLEPDPANRFQTFGTLEQALAELPPAPAGWSRRHVLGSVAALSAAGLAVVFARPWIGGGVANGLGDIRTVAVLPFVGSGDPRDDAIGRGLTELLTARLCEITSLRVVSQTSVRQVQEQALVAADIGRALGVEALVEGSIQSSGDRVRVDVRLVRAAADQVIWTDSFEDDVRDVLALQANLALAVGRQMTRALTQSEVDRLTSPDTASRDAQDAFLRGWAALEKQTPADTHLAVQEFEAAVRLDPAYARAHAMLSHAYWSLGVAVNDLSRAATESAARASAHEALRLDPGLPRAHAALAQVYFYFDWDWPNAEREFETAIRLNPSDADAHQQYGWFQAALGRSDQALDAMWRSRELDPLSYSRRSPLAAVLYYAGRYADAEAELQAVLDVNPNFRTAHFGLARVHAATGRTSEAIRILDDPMFAGDTGPLIELGRVLAQAGDLQRARECLRTLEARRAAAPESVPADGLAILHAALGETDRALDLIEQAHGDRSPALLWAGVDPRFDGLRPEPRFRKVMAAMGL